MKRLILSTILTIQMAYSDGIVNNIVKNFANNYDLMPKKFMIGDETKVKIDENKTAYIVNGTSFCNYTDAYLLGKPNDKCTVFESQDKSKFLVQLFHSDDKKISNEEWTVSKKETIIQVLRPNGFKIEIMQ
jgi:hypothetical protein